MRPQDQYPDDELNNALTQRYIPPTTDAAGFQLADPAAALAAQRRRQRQQRRVAAVVTSITGIVVIVVALISIIPRGGHSGTTTGQKTPHATAVVTGSAGATATAQPTAPAVTGASTCSDAGYGTTPARTGNNDIPFPFVAGAVSQPPTAYQDRQLYQYWQVGVCVPSTDSARVLQDQGNQLAQPAWAAITIPAGSVPFDCTARCWQTALAGPKPYGVGAPFYASLSAATQNGQVVTYTVTLVLGPGSNSAILSDSTPTMLDADGSGDIQGVDATHFKTVGNAAYAELPSGMTLANVTCAALSNLPFSAHIDPTTKKHTAILADPMSLVGFQTNQTHWAIAQFSYTSQGLQIAWQSYFFCLG